MRADVPNNVSFHPKSRKAVPRHVRARAVQHSVPLTRCAERARATRNQSTPTPVDTIFTVGYPNRSPPERTEPTPLHDRYRVSDIHQTMPRRGRAHCTVTRRGPTRIFPSACREVHPALLGRVDGSPIAVARDAQAQPRQQRIGIAAPLCWRARPDVRCREHRQERWCDDRRCKTPGRSQCLQWPVKVVARRRSFAPGPHP